MAVNCDIVDLTGDSSGEEEELVLSSDVKRAQGRRPSEDLQLGAGPCLLMPGSHVSKPPLKVSQVILSPGSSAHPSRFPRPFQWHTSRATPTLLHATYTPPPPSSTNSPDGRLKIAAFDLDGTLIATRTGKPFPANADDWRMWSTGVLPKLKALHASGHAIVIFTNQGYTFSDNRLAWFKAKIPILAGTLAVPFRLFAATKGHDANKRVYERYRKPFSGMWDVFVQDHCAGIGVDMTCSFFVGDAAGRAQDHSADDLGFAQTVGLRFYTPEQYFA